MKICGRSTAQGLVLNARFAMSAHAMPMAAAVPQFVRARFGQTCKYRVAACERHLNGR
jgi:hypothetical protein